MLKALYLFCCVYTKFNFYFPECSGLTRVAQPVHKRTKAPPFLTIFISVQLAHTTRRQYLQCLFAGPPNLNFVLHSGQALTSFASSNLGGGICGGSGSGAGSIKSVRPHKVLIF